MKFNIFQQMICFCLIKYVFTFPNDLFDELWQKNELTTDQSNNKSWPKIKVEPHQEQFHASWQDESALNGSVKVEHEPPHYGAVKVEAEPLKRTVKIKHEFVEQNVGSQKIEEHLNLNEHQLIMDKPLRENSRNNARSKMAQNESFEEAFSIDSLEESEETNNTNHSSSESFQESDHSESDDFNETDHYSNRNDEQNSGKRISYSDEEKVNIVNKFLKMRHELQLYDDKRSCKEIGKEISNKLGVKIRTIYKWKKDFGFLKKRPAIKETIEIVKRFKKLKKENPQLNKKEIAKRLQISLNYLYQLNKQFKLGVKKRKFYSTNEKIAFLKHYDKIKNANPQMSIREIAKQLPISRTNLSRWQKEFGLDKNNNVATDYLMIGSKRRRPPLFLDENAWGWNRSTKKRKQI